MTGKDIRLSLATFFQSMARCLIVMFILSCILTIDISHGTLGSRRGGQQSSRSSHMPNSIESYTDINWVQYTPTTPSPENVNCYVEIPETRLVGGICVNLGRYTGCQAGMYLAFSDECQTMVRGSRSHSGTRTSRGHRFRRRQNRLRRRFGSSIHRSSSNSNQ